MESRTTKTIRNVKWGLINTVSNTVLPFIVRSILIYRLGEAYSGLGSLFTSILSVLSLSELGFSNAIVFSMYKPVAENDKDKICALLNVYKKAYRIIGLAISLLGLCLLPFLQHLIKGSVPADINIYVLYLVFLFNTVISYFLFAYKTCLLSANQREDALSRNSVFSNVIIHVLQCAVLLIFSNYYIYAILLPVSTVLLNLLNKHTVDSMYPSYDPHGSITDIEKTNLRKNIAGLTIWKIGSTTRNTLDSIVISAFIGLSTVAIYNNYYLIMAGIISVLGIITRSIIAGVGNKIVTETPEKNYKDFLRFRFYYMFLATWCATCMMSLYQPFMKLWMGESRMLPDSIVILMCLYFLCLKKGDINSVYYQAAGLWWKGRMCSIIEAALNLTLNIILGKYYGLWGIVWATIISNTIISFYASSIVFTHYFKNKKCLEYYLNSVLYVAVGMGTGYLLYKLIDNLNRAMEIHNLAATFVFDSIIAGLLAFILLIFMYSIRNEYREYMHSAYERIKNRIIRIYGKLLKRHTVNSEYKNGLNRTEKRDKLIIVSLTSFPERFSTLHICLNSLLNQTVKPDRIIVWLDNSIDRRQFTKEMLKMESYGIEYVIQGKDLQPHKKYYYAMKMFPDDLIITVDDDVVYTPKLVETLVKSYKSHPNAVSARRVHQIKADGKGNLLPYKKWVFEFSNDTNEHIDLLACGVGGVLYPPHLLPDETFDIAKIEELCLRQDDLWLKFMEAKNKIPVVWCRCLVIHPPVIEGTQEISLYADNVSNGENDICIVKLANSFPEETAEIVNACGN